VERTLFVAERFRTALLGRAGEILNGASPSVLSGHGADGAPRRGHGHACYLPVDSDGDGFVDQLIVHAPDGFELEVQRVLSSLRRLGRSDDAPRVALIGLGREDLRDATSTLGSARVWESATPFFAPRHLKPRSDGSLKHPPEAQIRLLCRDLGLPEPAIEPGPRGLEIKGRDGDLPWYRFKRDRFRGGGDRGSRTAYSFRLTFPVEIRGPLALGYAAHFGLGQFRPVRGS